MNCPPWYYIIVPLEGLEVTLSFFMGFYRLYIKSSTWHDIFIILAKFLDSKKCCRNYVEADSKWPKRPKFSTKAKNGCTWENNNFTLTGIMTLIFGWQIFKEMISHPVKELSKCSIWDKLLHAKKYPKLGIQLPNAGDDNQSCMILTFF